VTAVVRTLWPCSVDPVFLDLLLHDLDEVMQPPVVVLSPGRTGQMFKDDIISGTPLPPKSGDEIVDQRPSLKEGFGRFHQDAIIASPVTAAAKSAAPSLYVPRHPKIAASRWDPASRP